MIGIAAVCGAVSIFFADVWIKGVANARVQEMSAEIAVQPPVPEVAFDTIVVAGAPLRFGTELAADALAEIPWPQESLPAGAYATIEELLGEGARVVLSPIETNEPVLLAKLSGPGGRATLSNLLAPGMRAVTVRTDEIAGVGGFVTPGDRVDVVLTRNAGAIQEVAQNASGAAGSTVTSEVVVENARVLTVGQGADERQTSPHIANSVTIEVDSQGAQKVALARSVGSLSLQLRPAADAGGTGAGVTTISAFGGSVPLEIGEKAAAFFGRVAREPERPRTTTVVVTRGFVTESYEVLTPDR